ncbi:hypothetical protein C2845_PM06G24010 [Panicum miliaceum]|uniref:Uncharacterized protein n=1 Tax=Panicum miliaceum TaxID=4540 RepID=A0A3L6R5K1_PANMI|nr:hypothetical protein C2845_PM06G24010 [Panicum miliaceum]
MPPPPSGSWLPPTLTEEELENMEVCGLLPEKVSLGRSAATVRSSSQRTGLRRSSSGPSTRRDSAFSRGDSSVGFSTTTGWRRSTSSPTPSPDCDLHPSVRGVLWYSCPLQSLAGAVPPEGVSFEGGGKHGGWRPFSLRQGAKYLEATVKYSNKRWAEEWFMVANPPRVFHAHRLSPGPQRQVGGDAL